MSLSRIFLCSGGSVGERCSAVLGSLLDGRASSTGAGDSVRKARTSSLQWSVPEDTEQVFSSAVARSLLDSTGPEDCPAGCWAMMQISEGSS